MISLSEKRKLGAFRTWKFFNSFLFQSMIIFSWIAQLWFIELQKNRILLRKFIYFAERKMLRDYTR